MEIFSPRLTTKYFLADDELTGEKCRTCLKKTRDIWQVFQSDAEISLKIMACAAVQVQEGDGLPNVICYSCRELLDISYNFKCQVEKSDAKFREALKIEQPMYHDAIQSVNAVITDAISDEISTKQMAENINANQCVQQYQTEEYLHQQMDHDDDSIAYGGESGESSSDKKILDISPYVESRGIFDAVDLKSELINKDNIDDNMTPDHDASEEQENLDEKPIYLELTKNTTDNRDDIDQKIKEIDENEEKSINCRSLKSKSSQRVKELSNKLSMGRHKQVTVKKTKYRYVCYMCEKQFVNIEKLKKHIANSHNCLEKGILEFPARDTNVDNDSQCEENESEEKKKTKFSCNYCSKQFTYEKSFLSHAKRHPEYKKLNSSIVMSEECNERPSNDSEDDDMALEGLQCTQCGKLFATKRNLKRHISTHSGLKFNCPTCQKEFSRADKLKEHEQSKHGDEFFALSDDNNDTDSENESKTHGDLENRKKEKNSKPHQCPLCPRSFAHNSTLTNHVERHKRKQPQKRFLCEVCSKCFAQSGSLVAHMRTHTGVKPYVCNVCSRAFTKSTYLQLHLRTHSGEKPYICQYCSRAFARANTLARHITMHTGEAKYHCQICMKSFRRLTSLNEHTYTHTGQRPYACKICTKRYNNAGSLYAHTKKCKAQQLSNNSVMNNYTVLDNSNPDDPTCVNNETSSMLMYTAKKCGSETRVDEPLPEFILPNVPSQKPLSPNIIQPGTTDDNLYSVNTKQFKNFYYTTYPNL